MKITLEIKNPKDWELLKPLLERLRINVIENVPAQKETPSTINANDFFESAGLFKNRAIDANTLRTKAWKLNK